MTAPFTPPVEPARLSDVVGLVDEWEFGCCAPRPVVGGTTWWRWTFHPQLDDPDVSSRDPAVFTHKWSLSSTRTLANGSTALELRSDDFVAWWMADEPGDFIWLDPVLGRRQVPAAAADTLVGQDITLRGRLVGGRHGGGLDAEFPYTGARVHALTVLGHRLRIEADRSRTTLERTTRPEPVGPPRFRSYPESTDPPIVYRENALLMDMTGLAPPEAVRDRRRWNRDRIVPVDDLRALLASVQPIAAGKMLTATRLTTELSPHLPPGFRAPGSPDEWTTQESDLLGDGGVTALHRRTLIRRLGPTDAHPEGAEREEFPDGTPRTIRSGRRRWRFPLWADDTFFVPGDPELTAVASTAASPPDPCFPPRPCDWRALVDGADPVGEIRATTAAGRPCWTYTRPGPPRAPWAVSRVIVDAETGWLVCASHYGGSRQVRYSDVRIVDSPSPDDLALFRWDGPSRSLAWYRRDWVAVHPVRRT